ncbi:MAG TPA: mannose-1-phosphate guanylyltransferase/mannose-6-phosphate isomerase [Pseudomonadales bacterium]|nr:mannose-1-phosphate guanylyltransferase/mannose-6-phosphate isomerase [Pseudomonadales bacterium]
MIIPVILSGGAGKRLWPLSRESHPKQFLPLFDGKSLFNLTLARVQAEGFAAPMVICNSEHRFMAAEQLGSVESRIIIEPCSRNTAPAVAIAALAAQPDDILLVLPSDHLFTDADAFRTMMLAARPLAEAGHLVTFGVQPVFPATGYGYIKRGTAVNAGNGFYVEKFVEKPDAATAQQYLISGDYLWNCGVFMFRAAALLQAMRHHAPAVIDACTKSYAAHTVDLGFIRLDNHAFAAAPDISIDYAVMEHTDKAVVVPCHTAWSDVGSWSSLADSMEKDSDGNVVRGDVVLQNTQNSTVFAEEKLVVVMGVDNLIVVETDDAILVAPRAESENIKKIVETLTEQQRSHVRSHRKVYRPWGFYDSIGEGDRHKVKRITVKPGGCLSLQMHHHRAEHWIVVRGTARVVRGDEEFLLSENQSTYIPLGVTHRLENPGSIALELIEVQSGTYLGEDDIVRFEDHYGRGNQQGSSKIAIVKNIN